MDPAILGGLLGAISGGVVAYFTAYSIARRSERQAILETLKVMIGDLCIHGIHYWREEANSPILATLRSDIRRLDKLFGVQISRFVSKHSNSQTCISLAGQLRDAISMDPYDSDDREASSERVQEIQNREAKLIEELDHWIDKKYWF